MMKPTKITANSQQAKQLVTFVASLGVSKPLELYSCEGHVYINADIVLPVLSVDLRWFHKNATSPMHYLIVNKCTYINRYGMTKLLGQSQQQAAFRLQDYLYELFYKVETEGVVHRDSLVSRKKLLSLEENLDVYKSIIENNQSTIEEARDYATAALNDCNFLEAENTRLSKQIEQLEDEIKDLNENLETFQTIANKLARYVRVKATKVPDEAYSNLLDIPEDSDTSMIYEAIQAKAKLKEESKKRLRKRTTTVVTKSNNSDVVRRKYFWLRSAGYISGQNYAWKITDIEPSSDLIVKSEDFLMGDPVGYLDEIIYRTVEMSDDKKNAVVLFIEVTGGIFDETTALQLISS